MFKNSFLDLFGMCIDRKVWLKSFVVCGDL